MRQLTRAKSADAMKNNAPKKKRILSQLEAADWPELRKRGKRRFVITHRVIPMGIPLGAVMSAWWFRELGMSVADVITIRGLGTLYLNMLLTAGSAYFYGSDEWERRERRYRGADNLDDGTPPNG